MNKWLGDHTSGFELFPDGKLNAKQISDLLAMQDPAHGSIFGLRAGTRQQILQLTDDGIVEVHVNIGHARRGIWYRHAVVWMTDEGTWIASCIQKGEQNNKTQKFEGDLVEGYLWTKDMIKLGRFGREPITKQYEHGMFSLGNSGAVPEIRKFIKENYVNND